MKIKTALAFALLLGHWRPAILEEIRSELPDRAEWMTGLPSGEVTVRLKQPFRYLGEGVQSIAFLGRDEKTVLKFFRHGPAYSLDSLFESCLIAARDLPEETGLLYLHLNKTKNLCGEVALEEMGWIDLDRTEFALQEYCEPALPAIDAADPPKAQRLLQAIFAAVRRCQQQGIHIQQPALHRNVGFLGERAVLFDIGSFVYAPCAEEVPLAMHRIERWLKKHRPELLTLFVEEEERQG